MREARTVADVRSAVRAAKTAGARVAFVPTMGFLHDGHLRLVDEARRVGQLVVMSIFVNPLQFGPREDFARYPRDMDGDTNKSRERGVDLLFVPELTELYPTHPEPPTVTVAPHRLDARWEGEVRPGHFAGVLTVVAKLFNIVQPDVAIFGQKDIQQATMVRAMIRDLNMPLELLVVPTVREPDGLAMSSRNSYLTPDDRQRAVVLSRGLKAVERRWLERGDTDARALEAEGRRILADEPAVVPDYFALIDPRTLEPATVVEAGTIVVVAARVGATRLIDNLILPARSAAG